MSITRTAAPAVLLVALKLENRIRIKSIEIGRPRLGAPDRPLDYRDKRDTGDKKKILFQDFIPLNHFIHVKKPLFLQIFIDSDRGQKRFCLKAKGSQEELTFILAQVDNWIAPISKRE